MQFESFHWLSHRGILYTMLYKYGKQSRDFGGVVKARIHCATLRAILRTTSVTRRGYTVATFRATLRAIFDQWLPSCHAMMFYITQSKVASLSKKKALGVLALMI